MIKRNKLGRFVKGSHPSKATEFKKGIHPKTEFKKGQCGGKNNPFYGRYHIEESREKMGQSGEEHYLYKKTYEEAFGKEKAKEIRRKMSEGKLGDKNPVKRDDVRNKISKTKIRLYKEGKIERINSGSITKEKRALQIFPIKDTKIEVKIQNFLKKLGIEFFTHQYMKQIKHAYECDILIPSMNLVIECDGDYWHKYPIGRDIDHIRTKELIEKGFKILRLWEVEINKMSVNDFQNKIETFK